MELNNRKEKSKEESKSKIFGVLLIGITLFFLSVVYFENQELGRLRVSLDRYKAENIRIQGENDKLRVSTERNQKEIDRLETQLEFAESKVCRDNQLENKTLAVLSKVSEIRELDGTLPDKIELMTPDQAIDYIIKSGEEAFSDGEIDLEGEALKLMGLIPEEMDYENFLNELYEEQVGGFYDTNGRKMVIVSEDASKSDFTPIEEFILSHELTHSLQDQNFSFLREIDNLAGDSTKSDEFLAGVSVIEGDATLAMTFYLQKMSSEDLKSIGSASAQLQSDKLDSAPIFIKGLMLFPYEEGESFVSHIFNKNRDWKDINNLFENPPVSTEQILHPEKFPGEVPVSLEISKHDYSGEENQVYETVLGEFGYRLLFQQYLGLKNAKSCAEGWGGDLFSYSKIEGYSEIVLKSEWDSDEELDEAYICFEDLKSEFEVKDVDIEISKYNDYLVVNFIKS